MEVYKIPCQICGEEFEGIIFFHLKEKHNGMSTVEYKNQFPGAQLISKEIGNEKIKEQKLGLEEEIQKESAEIESFKKKIVIVKEEKENQIRLKKLKKRLERKEERLKKQQSIKPLKQLERQLENIQQIKERYRKKLEEVNNA